MNLFLSIKKAKLVLSLVCLFSLPCRPLIAQVNYKVDLNSSKGQISPTLWGLFFEDINRSGDGGMYAELVKNRSFDFPDPYMGWKLDPPRHAYDKHEIFQVINQSAVNENNPKYLQITINKPEKVSLANEGFGGITVKKGMEYELTVVCRQKVSGITLKFDLVNANNKSVGNTTINPPATSNEWQTVKAMITTNDTTIKGKLVINFEGTGKVDIDRVSLFPSDTWMNRKGGLRNDLVQQLYDIHPGFLRFPGGCIVEGKTPNSRYQWKTTIGPLEQRKLIANQWQEGAAGKPLPDYFQSFGLGFYEYFQLCDDLKAAALPIINCGLSCQFDAAEVVPMDEMDAYVQDALDLIEFANGDVTTPWGKKRAEMGHPASFNLKMLGVGNENWGPQYLERLELFRNAIKAKYPEMQLICATGYSPNPQFHYMDSALRKMNVDIIDEHYYQTANWFLMNANKYDHYDRKGPKIFLGEYACMSTRIGSPENKNTLLCALAEAAFMTGIERNADIICMASYAPLFAHVKDWQWTPNLIWFDNSTSYRTPSYYVQQLFSLNKGTDLAAITENGNAIAGSDSVWASAVVDKQTSELIIKLVNPSGKAKEKKIALPETGKNKKTATITVLKATDGNAMNSLGQPSNVTPVSSTVPISNNTILVALPKYSFNVIKIKL